MRRHYFIANNLDELAAVQQDLLSAGLTQAQIHVLSEAEAELERRQLHTVEAVLKKDVVRGTERGAAIGLLLAAAVLLMSWGSGLVSSIGWVPPVFLSLVVLGFCTWEGGLIGIGEQHADFKRFRQTLDEGGHVLFVDVDEDSDNALQRIIAHYPELERAGEGTATPTSVIRIQDKWSRFMELAP